MIILPVYAIAIWTVIAVFRRRWQAFVITGLSVLPVGWITHLCVQHIPLKPGEPRPTWLYMISLGYGALILVIGLVIAVQRRDVRVSDCRACGYDLSGSRKLSCPECGEAVVCVACHRAFEDDEALRCPACLTPAPVFPARDASDRRDDHRVEPFSRRLMRFARGRGSALSLLAGAQAGDGGGGREPRGDEREAAGDLSGRG